MKNVTGKMYSKLFDRISLKVEEKIGWYMNDIGTKYNHVNICLVTLWSLDKH